MNGPRGMPTNGEKQFCDWLNHTRSMADVPEFWTLAGGQLHVGYVRRKTAATWRGKPVYERRGELLWRES